MVKLIDAQQSILLYCIGTITINLTHTGIYNEPSVAGRVKGVARITQRGILKSVDPCSVQIH